jgi:hypothetical protein
MTLFTIYIKIEIFLISNFHNIKYIIYSFTIKMAFPTKLSEMIEFTLDTTKGEFFEKRGDMPYFQGMPACVQGIKGKKPFDRIKSLLEKMGKHKKNWIIEIDENTTFQIQGIRSELDGFLVFTVKDGEKVQNLVFADLNDHIFLVSILYSYGYYFGGNKSAYARQYIFPGSPKTFIDTAFRLLDVCEQKLEE